MESYFMTPWIDFATATTHGKSTGNVPTVTYIGQTQQKLKDQTGQHLNDVKKLVIKVVKSDSFLSHFAYHCKKGVKPTSDELCNMMKVKIVWQGNAISCMKSFGKLNCSLCMQERIEILCTIHQEECWRIINNCNEIYFGACRHKMRFHRFLKEHTDVKNTSTDEGDKPEKVYKYDDRDRFSDSDDSQESSPHPAGFTDVTPPPGALDICTLILPRMCILGCFKEDNKSKCREQGKRRPPNSLECHWFDWRI
jgi:hypothetical protein